MEKKLFKIDIASTGLSTATDEVKGFLDNLKAQDYSDFDITKQPIAGETLAQYIIKARGYVRWRQMSYNISQGGIFYIGDYQTTGADHITPPTSLSFKVGYERFDGMVIEDENNPGEILTGVDALKRRIALSLVDNYNINEEYFDNTKLDNGACYGYANNNIQVNGPATGANRKAKITMAEGLITITEF
jgi:hypothetical protein